MTPVEEKQLRAELAAHKRLLDRICERLGIHDEVLELWDREDAIAAELKGERGAIKRHQMKVIARRQAAGKEQVA